VTAHASWAPVRTDSYERLAFVGDSLLSQIVTLHLDREYPREEFTPGTLTRIRAKVVSDDTLHSVASELGLGEIAVALAPESDSGSARALVSSGKPLASMLEALIAACWQVHGPQATSAAVIEALSEPLARAARQPADPKTLLQERLARAGSTVRYQGSRAESPDHAPVFDAVAFREPEGTEIGSGRGTSKKAAEVAAAEQALAVMAEHGE
jgi:ribonuclease-3